MERVPAASMWKRGVALFPVVRVHHPWWSYVIVEYFRFTGASGVGRARRQYIGRQLEALAAVSTYYTLRR
eukprot:scaffold31303_cov157-Isochrysis_galbana.AAC.3